MITREQFESGQKFTLGYLGEYTYHKEDNFHGQHGHIRYYGKHECNVSRITDTGFTWYISIMGKQVKGTVRFENLNIWPAPELKP